MSEQPTKTDPVLLQMVGTLAELKKGQEQQNVQLGAIQQDIRQFDVKITSLQKDVEQAQQDIAKRTHTEETNRLKQRVHDVEQEVAHKANTKLVFWVLAMIGSMFIAMISTAVKLLLFP